MVDREVKIELENGEVIVGYDEEKYKGIFK
jgi:hypothetical protein